MPTFKKNELFSLSPTDYAKNPGFDTGQNRGKAAILINGRFWGRFYLKKNRIL
jgi:hypothetical protein